MDSRLLNVFCFEGNIRDVSQIHGGLINKTWRVATDRNDYILQTVNHHVFKKPLEVAANIRHLADFFALNFPDYIFTAPVKTKEGNDMFLLDGNYYRSFPFIKNSHSIAVVQNAEQAFEAAKQFGKFTSNLQDFNAEDLHITIPDFHNLTLRYQQFLEALENGDGKRKEEAKEVIEALIDYAYIANTYQKIKTNPAFKIRVTHHDTKISNVLFDNNDKGICVIDLDTVMPGYFISDVGDMMRTYLSPASEEVKNFDEISVRKEIFAALKEGYLSEMDKVLSDDEKQRFEYSGRFLIYMQALRFITDFLNRDVYYGEKYPGHNLVRGANQLRLMQEYERAALS